MRQATTPVPARHSGAVMVAYPRGWISVSWTTAKLRFFPPGSTRLSRIGPK
jgi:hypothetical protein